MWSQPYAIHQRHIHCLVRNCQECSFIISSNFSSSQGLWFSFPFTIFISWNEQAIINSCAALHWSLVTCLSFSLCFRQTWTRYTRTTRFLSQGFVHTDLHANLSNAFSKSVNRTTTAFQFKYCTDYVNNSVGESIQRSSFKFTFNKKKLGPVLKNSQAVCVC